MRSSVVTCVLCLCAWLPVATATTAPTAWGDDAQCSNAVRLQHPVCHHGGYLFANHTTDAVNCADCVCPDGWAGTDCSSTPRHPYTACAKFSASGAPMTERGTTYPMDWTVCTGVDACPPQRTPGGGERDARACTWRSLIPNTLERTAGKRYSCTCGMPGDVWSEYYCRLQPHTNFLLNLVTTVTDAASQSTTLQVDAYGGMPSQDMTVSDHYDFAVPGWWDSEFSGCEWTRDACDSCPKDAFCPWSDEEQCYFLECKSGDVSCPPSYATPCPGYTRNACGTSPEGGGRYWQHHCSVLATPKSGLGFRLMCQTSDTAAAPGVFNCSFSQPGSTTLVGLGMQCRTGACEYEEAPAPVDPGKGHEAHGFPAATKVVLACTAAALLLCVVAVAAFMRTHVVHMVPHAESLLVEQHDGVDDAQPSPMMALLGQHPHPAAALPIAAAAAASPRPQLSWHFVRCDVRQWNGLAKTLLLDVCGVAGGASGTGLFALMGPSGSGKSTLLDVLSGRHVRGHVSGSIRLDGVVTTKAARRSICGYVLQDEVLPGTQTVWEYLLFHASLRLPSSTTPANRVRRVRDTVTAMGLQRVAASVIGDVFVRGLSGGERRRLAIGAELLAAPRLLLLDEPTTGLDSASAGAIVDLLAELGRGDGGGISAGPSTVLVSLHQPSLRIFRTLERVLLLCGGRAMFTGPTDGLRAHFSAIGSGTVSLGAAPTPRAESSSSTADPAAANLDLVERLLDMLTAAEETETEASTVTGAGEEQQSTEGGGREESTCDETGAEMGQAWTGARATPPPSKYMCGFGRQLYVLSGRQLANLVRHPLLFALVYGSSLGAAVVLGLVFYDAGFDTAGIQNRLGSLFFMVIFLSLLSLSILPVWREEQLLFVCERANGCYSTGAYFTAVVLFDLLPLRVVPPCMFAFVSYWLIGLRAGSIASLLWFMLILVLSNLTSTTLCMAVGVFTSSDATANVASTFLLVASMLYGGFMLSLSHMPPSMQLLSELSFVKHAFEALAVNEFSDPRAVYVFTAAIPSDELPPLRCSGDYVLQEFGFRRARFHANVAALVGMCVVTLTLTYMGLAASDTGVWYRLQQRVTVWRWHRRRKRPNSHSISNLPGTGDDVNGRGATPTAAVLEPLLPAAARSDDFDSEIRVSIPEERIHTTASSPMAPDVEAAPPSCTAQRTAQRTTQSTTVLSWHNITYTVRDWRGKTKSILRDVSGLAGSGTTTGADREEGAAGGALCAVLGPSGAGKSSLLDILSGRVSLSDRRGGVVSGGVITAAGRQITGTQLQAVVGYVPQEVVLPATSTVTEYLTFHGELRLPWKAQRYRGAAVRRVMDLLGLRKVQHSMVGDAWVRGLSGGERRRLSVGAELIHTPAVLIMDEPTTGLDGSNARKLLSLLAELSRTSTTIVLSLHQPSASMLRVFHRAVVLSGTGGLVFSGPYSTLADHFAALELQGLPRDALGTVDGVLEALGGARATTGWARELQARFPTSPAGVAEAVLLRRELERAGIGPGSEGGQRRRRRRPGRVRAANSAGFVRQLAALRTRHTYKLLRDPSVAWLSYGAHAAMATGVGLAYRNAGFDTWGIQNRMGALFFILVYLALLSLSSLPLWREERALFLRERASGVYGTGAYFVTVVLFDLLPLRILPPCLLTIIAYPLVGFQHESWRGPACFTAVVILSNMVSTTMSMAVSALAPNNAVANVVGSLAALLSVLTGGFLLSKAHPSPVTAVVIRGSYINYAFEALLVNEFAGQRGFAFTSYTKPPVAVSVTGDQVLETFGFHPKAMLSDTGWLVAMAVGFLLLTYVLLHLKRR